MAIEGMKTIIAAQTGSATVDLDIPAGKKTMVTCGKLTGAETVTFQLIEEGVGTPGDLYQDGSQVQLDATHNATVIEGPLAVRVTKSATTASTGVYAK